MVSYGMETPQCLFQEDIIKPAALNFSYLVPLSPPRSGICPGCLFIFFGLAGTLSLLWVFFYVGYLGIWILEGKIWFSAACARPSNLNPKERYQSNCR